LQRVPGTKDAATTCVALVDEAGGSSCRLFTAGLDGAITEIDLEHRRAAAATDSYGGAVWQLAPEPAAAAAAEAASPQHEAEDDAAGAASAAPAAAGGESSSDDDADAAAPAAASPRLAAACDDGCVRLFTVDPGVPGASYAKSLPRVEGRCLAVAWHPSGRCLASAGTDGCIHVWDVASGREALRISAGDASGRDTVVWALLVLPDGTLVSGDSGGGVAFWDARFGTLLARFQQHAADVLQLAASPDGDTVFAAGADPRVAVFQRVAPGGGGGGGAQEWAFLSSKRPHTHDVRAMCVTRGRHAGAPALWTGGNDTLLLLHPVARFLMEHPSRVETCPQRPALAAAAGAAGAPARLLCAQANQVDLWELPPPADVAAAAGGAAAVEGAALKGPAGAPRHLARVVNRGGAFVMAAALSADGGRIAFSDAHRVRCFSVAGGGGGGGGAAPVVAPLRLPADLPPAAHLAFQPGSNALVCTAVDGTVRLVRLPADDAQDGAADGAPAEAAAQRAGEVVHTIRELHDLRYRMWYKRDRGRSAARRAAPALGQGLAALSPDGRWLAAAVRGRVHLLCLNTHRVAAQLPPAGEPAALTALGFTGDGSRVVVATAANQVATYDVPSGQPSEWTRLYSGALPPRLLALPGPIAGLAANPAAPADVLLFSPEAVCHVDFGRAPGGEPGGGKRRAGRERGARAPTPAGRNCRALYCADPVLHVQYLGAGEVLVVERAWAEVWRGLPPPLHRHRYGT
jgi:U3 small nucleolar RNA-associated protein 4